MMVSPSAPQGSGVVRAWRRPDHRCGQETGSNRSESPFPGWGRDELAGWEDACIMTQLKDLLLDSEHPMALVTDMPSLQLQQRHY